MRSARTARRDPRTPLRRTAGRRHSAQRPRPKRILIVEDEDHVRDAWLEAFGDAGFAAVGARSGVEATEWLEEIAPDVIVLDMIMPGGDGFDLLVWLRTHQPWRCVPVVVVSALGDFIAELANEDVASPLGVVRVLSKPIDARTLIHEVCVVLEGRR